MAQDRKAIVEVCGTNPRRKTLRIISVLKVVLALVVQPCLTLCSPTRLLYSWDSPGKNTGVDSQSLLQGIFLTQNLGLLHCRQILYCLSHWGRPFKDSKKDKSWFRKYTVVCSPWARITLDFGTFPKGQYQTVCPFTLEPGREILYVGALVGAHKRSPISVSHFISIWEITLVILGLLLDRKIEELLCQGLA